LKYRKRKREADSKILIELVALELRGFEWFGGVVLGNF